MEIIELNLKNFRNYANEKVNFSSGLNLLVGDNAQGKTNVVEAVMLCCVGRSPRTAADKELIKFGEDYSNIKTCVKTKGGKTAVEIYITKKENKRIRVNDIPISKMGELMGCINAVYFSPDDLSLIKEAPEKRRRLLDIDISQLKKSYFYNLRDYNEILSERNNLLKKYSKEVAAQTIDIWDTQLAKVGSYIIMERHKFCEQLKGYVNECHKYITDGKEDMKICYHTNCKDLTSQFTIAENLYSLLKKDFDRQIKLGYTTYGPHRDDIKVTVNDIDIRSYGSQGQQRTSALSLKLGELKLFKEQRGEYPVLLLDDVLSELDDGRQKKLIEYTNGIQTILTAAKYDTNIFKNQEVNIINIKNGMFISPIK